MKKLSKYCLLYTSIVPDGAFTMETRYCRPAEFEQEYGAA